MKTTPVTCAYCGAVKEVPASIAGRYKTCGSPECLFKRRADGGKKNVGKVHSAASKAQTSATLKGRPRAPGVHQKMVDARKASGQWFKDADIGAKISAGIRASTTPRGLRGPANPMWKGGVSGLPQGYRGGEGNAEWRRVVVERAGGKCEQCGSERFVIAHHIAAWQTDPLLRLDPENGMALCRKCHAIEHQLVNNLPTRPGPWPDRPAITTILCKVCGAVRYVRTCRAHQFSTCGAKACVRQRIRDGIKNRDSSGQANSRYKDGRWATTEKTCLICNATFAGPAKRIVCSAACSAIHRGNVQRGRTVSEETRAKMRAAPHPPKSDAWKRAMSERMSGDRNPMSRHSREQ